MFGWLAFFMFFPFISHAFYDGILPERTDADGDSTSDSLPLNVSKTDLGASDFQQPAADRLPRFARGVCLPVLNAALNLR